MMRVLFLLFIIMLAPSQAGATARLNTDAAARSIDITTGFDGAKIVIYGTRRGQGDLVTMIRGPDQSVVVRRKSRVFGVWMNTRSMAFDDVPGFYDIAASAPLARIAPFQILRRHNVGVDALEFDSRDIEDSADISAFREALIRTRQMKGLFPMEPRQVAFMDDEFFKVTFDLGSNVPAGIYRVDTFLFQDGDVTDTRSTEIKVAQNGFSADVFLFAHNQSFAYAVIVVFMALFFGWGAHILLRRE